MGILKEYETIQSLSNPQIKRLVGIEWSTFHAMLKVLEGHQNRQGRPLKLSLADQLLMSLSYWREYRTLFHVALS
ncbi:MAG: transposase family protein [Thiolinea sp.]